MHAVTNGIMINAIKVQAIEKMLYIIVKIIQNSINMYNIKIA